MSQLSFWLIENTLVIPKVKIKKQKKKIKRRLDYPSFYLIQKKKPKNQQNQKKEKKCSLFKYYKEPIEGSLPGRFRKAYKEVFHEDLKDDSYFPLLYTYVKEHNLECASRTNTFSALYHLYRSLTLTFCPVTIIIIIIHAARKESMIIGFTESIASLILAFVCFNGYLRYYRIFSSEVIQSFYVHNIQENNNNEAE